MATDTNVTSLVINKMTKAQYDALSTKSDTELYLVPDEIDDAPTANSDNPVKSGGVYTALAGKADTSDIPTKVSDLANDSGFITDAGVTSFNGSTGAVTYTAPVTSVNGSTGAVTVAVPTKTSDLTNDSGFVTEAIESEEVVTSAGTLTSPYANMSKATAIPAGGMLPNVYYALGTVSADTTMSLATPVSSAILNHYYFTFDIGSTIPTITWDSAITSWFGGAAPSLSANKHYEVSVLEGVGVFMEV